METQSQSASILILHGGGTDFEVTFNGSMMLHVERKGNQFKVVKL